MMQPVLQPEMVLETPRSFLGRQPANDAQSLSLMAFDETLSIRDNQNETAARSLPAFTFSFDFLM